MFNKKDLSIAIAAALALQVSQLHAQDSASPENSILEEVKVTATKREVSAQDIPANIPVVDEQRLRESYIYDISRLSQMVPGLNVIDYGADNARDIVIRGMKNTGLQEYSTSGTTNIFMDDTLLGSTNLDINDVERIEVLRGPQGVLYGGGSVGGTIRYVTHRPDPGRYGGWAEAGVSSTRDVSDLGWETRAVINMPLIEDTLALRLFAGYKNVPGYITKVGYPDRPGLAPIEKQDQNSNDRLNVRAALRWIMNDSIEATVAYTGQRLDWEGHSSSSPELGDEFTGAGGIVDEWGEEDLNLFTLDVVAETGFGALTSNSAYFEENAIWNPDGTRFLLELSEAAELYYEFFPQFVMQGSGVVEATRFTQEFRLVSTRDDSPVDYVAGVFYSDADDSVQGTNEETPGLPDFMNQFYFGTGVTSKRPDDFDYVSQRHFETVDWAVFGEITFNLTDRWAVTLGARYFEWDLKGTIDFAFPMDEEILYRFGFSGCAPTQGGIDPTSYPCTHAALFSQNKGNDSVYNFTTSYQFKNTDALMFFTIAQGYRPGGANAVSSREEETIDPRFLGYDPDKATSYELGFKSMLLDNRLRLNASIYHIDWKDLQLGTRVESGFSATVNGDGARINGLELDLTALLGDSWQLDFAVNHLDAELSEDSLTTPEVDGQKGDRLPGSARIQAYMALRYETQLANAMNLFTRLGGTYSGNVTSHLNDNHFTQLDAPFVPFLSGNRFFERMPSYSVWDFSLGLARDRWSVLAYVNNLLDEKYIVGTSTYELGWVDDPISRQHYYGRPRTMGIQFRYSF